MATKKSARASKIKEHIPEEAREHIKNAREEMRDAMKGLLPEGFVEHRKAARKEMMLAVRSLLDSAIQRMEEKA
jgi:hypothetical protein